MPGAAEAGADGGDGGRTCTLANAHASCGHLRSLLHTEEHAQAHTRRQECTEQSSLRD